MWAGPHGRFTGILAGETGITPVRMAGGRGLRVPSGLTAKKQARQARPGLQAISAPLTTVQTDNLSPCKTPIYRPQQLYATLAGKPPLSLASKPAARAALDLSATLSVEGDEVILFAASQPRWLTPGAVPGAGGAR
jgi:hypothetical protein